MRKLGIVVTFVFNNFQRKEIWRDTLKQSMRKSSILVTNVNINLQQTEVSRLILNHEWYLFWLPSILLFYLIKSGLQSQLRRFWAQQRQAHKYFRSVDPFQVFWFVQLFILFILISLRDFDQTLFVINWIIPCQYKVETY